MPLPLMTAGFAFGQTLYLVVSLVYAATVIGVVGVVILENRNPLKSLAWLSVLLLLPGLGLLLYLVFGRSLRNMRLISRRRRRRLMPPSDDTTGCIQLPSQELSPEATRMATLINSLTGARYSCGNSCEVFVDGDSKFEALIADLAAARHYILLQYYIFEDDNIGRRVADVLCERARAGVSVRVIYDHLGSIGVSNRFFDSMRHAGVLVEPFFKVTFPHLATRVNWRNHRKICVIDGVTGYIGGMNIADRYIDGGPKFAAWRDTHMRVTGAAVAALQYAFAVDWNFMGMPMISDRPAHDAAPLGRDLSHVTESAGMQLVTGGPTDEWSNLGFAFSAAITGARKRVYIHTPYFLPSESLLRALQSAALAKVDVRVIMPLHSDSSLLTFASRSYVAESLRAGIKIYFYEGGMLHSKAMIIDDDITTIGSTNFDFRSIEHNFECNMMIYSRSLNRRMRAMFMNDISRSRRIRFSQWRRRPLAHKFAESLLRLLSPIL